MFCGLYQNSLGGSYDGCNVSFFRATGVGGRWAGEWGRGVRIHRSAILLFCLDEMNNIIFAS